MASRPKQNTVQMSWQELSEALTKQGILLWNEDISHIHLEHPMQVVFTTFRKSEEKKSKPDKAEILE